MRRALALLAWGLLGLALLGCGAPSAARPRPRPAVAVVPPPLDEPPPRTLAAGGTRSCLLEAGEVYCWGMGTATPARVDGLGGAVSIAVYDATVCALDARRGLRCTVPSWDLSDAAPEVERFDALGPVLDVALGPTHACARTATHELVCWGTNERGELGVDAPRHAYVPLRPGYTARAIAAGARRTCRLTEDGEVGCWGAPFDYGSERVVAPQAVAHVEDGQLLALGAVFGCAARPGGPPTCWGRVPSPSSTPYRPPDPTAAPCPLPAARSIVAGDDHVCARDAEGRVRCLSSSSATRGDGVEVWECDEAGPVQDLEDVVELAAGAEHTCARRADGSVACWGSPTMGRLGACGGARLAPRRIEGLGPLRDVRVGNDGVCTLDRAGAVVCWGGPRRTLEPWSPDAPMATGIERLFMGPEDVCVSGADGALRCFGSHGGETPAPLPGVSHPRDVSVGRFSVLVLSDDGAIRCFGCDRWSAATGATFFGVPAVVGGVRGAVELRSELGQYCVRTSEGRVLCGFAAIGRDNRPPREVAGVRGAVSIAVDDEAGYAVLGDGRVVRWDLDAPPAHAAITPVAIDGNVVRIVSGRNTCAITDTGVLHCWGGTMGHHLGEARYAADAPRRIEDLANVDALSLRVTRGCALVDGDAWCWGPAGPREPATGRVLREVCVRAPVR